MSQWSDRFLAPWPVGCGVAWVVLVLVLAWRYRPPPARVRDLVSAPPLRVDAGLVAAVRRRRPVPTGGVRAGTAALGALDLVGRAARRLVGLAPAPVAERRLGTALVLAGIGAVISWPVAVSLGAAVWGGPWIADRRRRRRRHDRVVDELPDTIDLLRLALGSGGSLRMAVSDVAPRSGDTIGEAFATVVRQVGRGVALIDALDGLVELGEPFRPVLDAMLLSERHGAPILPLLDRLSIDARRTRRRRAEERVRRVPVKLLFPLVFCTLPAFGLLTVVPLLASALGRFSL